MTPNLSHQNKHFLRRRVNLVGAFFAVFFLALMGRAVYLQVFQAERLHALADREIHKQVELAPRRGIIFDRHQEELALSVETDSVFARPYSVTTPQATGRLLAQTLGLEEREIIKRLKQEKPFVWVARRVSPEKAQAVRSLELQGVGLLAEPRRFYPYTTLASHVIGFAGLDAKGLEGVEAEYDGALRGQAQKVAFLRDALGRTIHLDPQAFASLPEGNHVILTLDKRLQYVTEKALAATVARYKAVGGMAAVMLPQTGEVLALASVPNFNPNVFGLYDKQTYRNRLITDTYEPGSTFKIFVAGAALMAGKVTPESRFFCEQGEWAIGGRIIHDTHAYGQLTLSEIIKFSSNIGAAKVGQTMGAAELHRALQTFGFGRQSDVDLPGESGGILRSAGSWKPVDLANICFGQGVAVTGMQMLQAVSAIANGGAMMKPFLVRAVVDQGGKLVRETTPKVVGQPLTPQASRALTAMMTEVTQPGGTGTQARVDPYLVAGKTGTAQKLDPKGGYSNTDYMASFVGFLPADSPKVAVLVVIDSPRGQHYGGVVAGPAWSQIARSALEALGVGGGEEVRRLQAQAAPRPPAKAQPLAGDPAPAVKAGLMPDLKGYTLRQVMSLARAQQMQVKLKGWGRVVAQSPEPGSPLPKDQTLTVELAPAAEGGA